MIYYFYLPRLFLCPDNLIPETCKSPDTKNNSVLQTTIKKISHTEVYPRIMNHFTTQFGYKKLVFTIRTVYVLHRNSWPAANKSVDLCILRYFYLLVCSRPGSTERGRVGNVLCASDWELF